MLPWPHSHGCWAPRWPGAGARAAGSKTPSLVIHGAGARFAEHVFTKMNVTTARQILIDAISDPSSGKPTSSCSRRLG